MGTRYRAKNFGSSAASARSGGGSTTPPTRISRAAARHPGWSPAAAAASIRATVAACGCGVGAAAPGVGGFLAAAVACGSGPGSFTSLRIVGAAAKGLAFGLERPLLAVPSLLLAAPVDAAGRPEAGEVMVTLDALRGEWFAQPLSIGVDGRIRLAGPLTRGPADRVELEAAGRRVHRVEPAAGVGPLAATARWAFDWPNYGPVSLDAWEPGYGRLAEAQVQWEARHGRPLAAG